MPEIKGRTRVLEYKEVMDLFSRGSYKGKLLVSLLYLTGGRINEILNIEPEDIMAEEERVRINLKFSKRKDKKSYSTHTLSIKVSKKVLPMLKIIFKAKMDTSPGDKLLNMSRQWAWKILKSLDEEIYPHLFRHTRATRLAIEGAAGQQLKVFMGWKSSKMADEYVEATDKLIEDLEVN